MLVNVSSHRRLRVVKWLSRVSMFMFLIGLTLIHHPARAGAPILDIPSQYVSPNVIQVRPGHTVSFDFSVSNNDVPPFNIAGLGLSGDAPPGATLSSDLIIDSGDVTFAWTSDGTDGGHTYIFQINAVDVEGTDSETINIHVNAIPVLNAIGNRTITEGQTDSFTVSASDPDDPTTLTYSVSGLPSGATFNPSTRQFNWDPAENQGPKNHNITFFVMDDQGDFDSETITITVTEDNHAPVLTFINNQTVGETALLSFSISATDTDRDGSNNPQPLTFSLEGAPAGANLNANSGAFNWIPSETQGDDSYTMTVRVTDDCGCPSDADDSQEFTITVNEVNAPPVLASIGPKAVDEHDTLTITLSASDSDIPTQNLVMTAGDLPPGAAFDTVTGEFTWTPSETDGGTEHDVIFTVSDDGDPTLNDSETVHITANEVNSPPVLAQIPDTSGKLGTIITFNLSATDSDIPANILTYTQTGGPSSIILDPASGELVWPLSSSVSPGEYDVTFSVTDNGAPNQSDSQLVKITVIEENFLKNPGFQIAGKTEAKAKNWQGIDLRLADKRVCKPIPLKVTRKRAVTKAGQSCEFRFTAPLSNTANRKLRQQISVATFFGGDVIKFAGSFRAKTLTNGARVQLQVRFASGGGVIKRTVKLTTGGSTDPLLVHQFAQTFTLNTAPVEMWLYVITGKSSGKLFLDDLLVTVQPAVLWLDDELMRLPPSSDIR